jgi:predicted F0F1-ATPase subunit
MPRAESGLERKDARRSFARDLRRYHRREPEHRFLRSLALIGSVGWPIAGLSLGGALLGRHLDERYATGVRFTLMLLVAGAALGTLAAFRIVKGGAP